MEETIIAFAGILLGWLLNNINMYYANRVVKRKALGVLIQKIFWIRQKFTAWNYQMYVFKNDLSDFRVFEERRKRMHSVPLFQTIVLDDTITEELAAIDPILAIEIKERSESFKITSGLSEKMFEVADAANSAFMYYTIYFGSLVDSFTLERKIERAIVVLGKNHGLITGIKLRRLVNRTRDKRRPFALIINDHLKTLESNGLDLSDLQHQAQSVLSKIEGNDEEKQKFSDAVGKVLAGLELGRKR